MVKTYNPNTARIHVVPSYKYVLVNSKRFHFTRTVADVKALDELLTELGFSVIVTQALEGENHGR